MMFFHQLITTSSSRQREIKKLIMGVSRRQLKPLNGVLVVLTRGRMMVRR